MLVPTKPDILPAYRRTREHRARRALLERGGAEMRRSRRYREPLGLLVVATTLPIADSEADLDRATRSVLEAATRVGVDHLLRLDGSSFAALLPNTPMAGVLQAGARIKRTLERLTLADGSSARAIVGYGALAHADTTFAQMLARAESQLMDR